MDLFTYLLGKKGQNTQRDLFSYLLGKGAGGSGTYVNFIGTSLNISNTLRARIKNITLKGATSQYTTTGKQLFNINDLKSIPSGVTIGDDGYVTLNIVNNGSSVLYVDLPTHNLNLQNSTDYLLITEIENMSHCALLPCTQWGQITALVQKETAGISINTITTKATFSNDIGINTSVAIYANTTGAIKFRLSVYPYSTMTVDDFIYEKYTNGQPSPSPDYPQKVKVVTGEQNIQIGTTNYPLSFNTLELAKIGNYQDYIYGSPNNWYKYKYINKVIFNGTEDWSKLVENTNTVQFLVRSGIPEKAKGLYNAMSDLFKTYSGSVEEECITGQSNNTGLQIIINKTRANTKEDFKTWLSTHNVTAYYELNTPTQEQITDTTLIEQLNNLYNATSQEGTTYITCSSASDSNEIIVFSGDIKVTSVGNSLNTSLLSSNIQEEPNLDDVNETEDIEQNEEPIEEEVS